MISLSLDSKVAIISAAAAVVSAAYAWLSSRTASRALRLAEDDHRERHAGFDAYLINGVTYQVGENAEFAAFACSVINKANAPIAISRVDLRVSAFDEDGRVSQIILDPTPATVKPFSNLGSLPVPLNLPPRTTTSGWLSFKIPERVAHSFRIDKYELAFISSDGERATLSQYLLQSVKCE